MHKGAAAPVMASVALILAMVVVYFTSFRLLVKEPSWFDEQATYRLPPRFPTEVFRPAELVDRRLRPEWWKPRTIVINLPSLHISASVPSRCEFVITSLSDDYQPDEYFGDPDLPEGETSLESEDAD